MGLLTDRVSYRGLSTEPQACIRLLCSLSVALALQARAATWVWRHLHLRCLVAM